MYYIGRSAGKIRPVMIMILVLALALSSCGGNRTDTDGQNQSGAENPAENSAGAQNQDGQDDGADLQGIELIEDVGETRDLTEVSESAAESESLCAAAYCGSRGGYADALDAFEHLRLSEKYPDLAAEISVLDTGGNEFYVLVPSEKAVSVVIEGYGMDENGDVGPDGNPFYIEDGSPVVLLCNVSDIIPDTQVTVADADGNELIFSPSLSLENGELYAPGVVDFTDYDWAAMN